MPVPLLTIAIWYHVPAIGVTPVSVAINVEPVDVVLYQEKTPTVDADVCNTYPVAMLLPSYPYEIGIHVLDEDVIKNAQRKYKEALMRMKEF